MKVFIWFLFFLPIVYAAGNYDYFQLVQQWAPTVCRGISSCTYPEPMNFTIHGLWPSDSSRPEPSVCPGSPFNYSKIANLTDLGNYWPNITGDNRNFWKYEWENHGTCSEDRFDEFNYFSKALELKRNVDILHYLESAGISPLHSVTYGSSAISEAIVNGTGRRPRLWCYDNDLLEISVCYNLHLAYIDCPPQLLNNPRNKCEVGFPPDSNPNQVDESINMNRIDQRRNEL